MTVFKPFAALALAALAACAPVTRASDQPRPAYRIAALSVTAPETLRVSESIHLVPDADIVWQGDAPGDRRAQVAAVLTEAIDRAGIERGTPVDVAITIERFHGLSRTARQLTGGVYAVHFAMRLTDPETHQPVGAERQIAWNIPAFGTISTVTMSLGGLTEKQFVVERLSGLFSAEFGQ